jgi:hypothetical protein
LADIHMAYRTRPDDRPDGDDQVRGHGVHEPPYECLEAISKAGFRLKFL